MALKVLLLRSKLDALIKELDELTGLDAGLEARERELEAAIAEAESAEDRAAAEGLVNDFETERTDHENKKEELRGAIEALRTELAQAEALTAPPPVNDPASGTGRAGAEHNETRKDDQTMSFKTRSLERLSPEHRSALIAREEVKDFLARVRQMAGEKRAVTGAELTIPEVMLSLLRENVAEYSKLIRRVNLQRVPGRARQNIMGAIPEAVWTEACAALNELSIDFRDVEVDGFKVGGFFAVCNAVMEDSDLGLADVLLDALSRAVGKAVDKAIVYGTDNKMPMGIVTRLAQTSKPADYPDSAPEWVDLHTSNIVKLPAATGVAFFQQLLLSVANINDKYSSGSLLWVMNRKTKARFVSNGLSVNAAGAIVTGIDNSMPVLGGDIVTLDFMADDDVLVGYPEDYVLAERAGTALAMSEHVRFLQDQTVFKGTARYDGTPSVADAFALINVNNVAPTTSVTFEPDEANREPSVVAVVTSLTLSPAQWSASTVTYTASTSAASNVIAAIPSTGAGVEISVNGSKSGNGELITWETGSNTVKIAAVRGKNKKVYTITVTKS